MSKQSEAKEKQGYRTVPSNCGNCLYRLYTEHTNEYLYISDISEKNNRCGIGQFAVKKTAVCDMWKAKEPVK